MHDSRIIVIIVLSLFVVILYYIIHPCDIYSNQKYFINKNCECSGEEIVINEINPDALIANQTQFSICIGWVREPVSSCNLFAKDSEEPLACTLPNLYTTFVSYSKNKE